MNKIKIACVGFFQGFGGAEKSLINLANFLANNGHNVDLICLNTDEISYNLDKNLKVISLVSSKKMGRFRTILSRYFKFKKVICENKYDIVINFWVQPVIFLKFMKKSKRPVNLYSERGNPNDNEYRGILRILRNISFKIVDAFVFQSNKARDMFPEQIRKRSEVIHNPIFLNNTVKRENIKNEIVTVGRLYEQKNQQLLLEAFALFNNRNPDYVLKIYGDGPLEQDLKDLAKKLKIEDKVMFIHSIPDIHNKIIDAKIFVLTSLYEGMPNALLEAIALGIPTITTNYQPKSASEFITNDENGIICNSYLPEEICQKMEKLVSNEELYNKISINAKEIYNRLTPTNIYNEWQKIIEKLVKRNED